MAAAGAPPPPPPPSSSRESPGAGPAWAGALVFAGSGERDVALAKSFWSAVTLQPPLESCLGPRWDGNDTAASSRRSSTSAGPLAATVSGSLRRSHHEADKGAFLGQISFIDKKEEKTQNSFESEKSDEKIRYLQKAKKREEIIALLRKQREERIMKEMISQRHKPKTKTQESKVKTPESNLEDQESVKALP